MIGPSRRKPDVCCLANYRHTRIRRSAQTRTGALHLGGTIRVSSEESDTFLVGGFEFHGQTRPGVAVLVLKTQKWRWGPLEKPVLPEWAMGSPAATVWPTLTMHPPFWRWQ